jgi:gluconate 2-dehydrogenase gamma chain
MDSKFLPVQASRRDFLFKAIALVPVASLTACWTRETSAAGAQSMAAPSPRQPTTIAYAPKYFTAEEWAFINAACGRLIPEDETGPGAVQSGVPEFIDRQLEGAFGHAARWYTQGPYIAAGPEFGYQGKTTPREVYRAGMTAINSHCIEIRGGKAFADCDASTQDAVLKDVESGHIVFDDVPGKTFFMWLLQNTKEGYLADPIHGGNRDMGAWKMIGFPGARADFADWVTRYGVRYPLGPVGVAGSVARTMA